MKKDYFYKKIRRYKIAPIQQNNADWGDFVASISKLCGILDTPTIKPTENMKEPVIVQTDIKSKVRLEDKFDFNANVTIGLADGGDFYLVLDFIDLTMEELKTLAQLSQLPQRLSIKSDIIDREKYNITHIVVTKFSATSNSSMTWECLSDDPSLYNF